MSLLPPTPSRPTDPILCRVTRGRVAWWGLPSPGTSLSWWGGATLPKRKDFRGAGGVGDGVYWATPNEFSGGVWIEDAEIPELSRWSLVEIVGFSWERAEDGAEGRALASGGATRRDAIEQEAELAALVRGNIGKPRFAAGVSWDELELSPLTWARMAREAAIRMVGRMADPGQWQIEMVAALRAGNVRHLRAVQRRVDAKYMGGPGVGSGMERELMAAAEALIIVGGGPRFSFPGRPCLLPATAEVLARAVFLTEEASVRRGVPELAAGRVAAWEEIVTADMWRVQA